MEILDQQNHGNVIYAINQTIIDKYCKHDGIDNEDVKLIELLMYLLYTKRVNRDTLLKVIDKLDKKIQSNTGPFSLDGIIDRIKPFVKLLHWLPTNEFCTKEKLFESITEARIEKIYEDNLPDDKTMKAMDCIINDLQLIISEWDDEATIVPFGSSANGFMLK